MPLLILDHSLSEIEPYLQVGIGYQITTRLDLDRLAASGGEDLAEIPTTPKHKDYDALESPRVYSSLWDVSNWRILAAFEDGRRVGGAIVARDTPGFDMLEGRADLVIIVDLRVDPNERGHGVGTALFRHAEDWARGHRCRELRVETQDTNVPACRFYQGMGCRPFSIEKNAYPGLDEAKIIWAKRL